VLEIKGEDSDQNKAKRMALDAWVKAVNEKGGFGTWCWDVVKGEPSKVDDIIGHHSASGLPTTAVGEDCSNMLVS
jgi:type III restriction enzyme